MDKLIIDRLPQALHLYMDKHSIGPDQTYTASAGKDYGQVKVWNLELGLQLVVWGNNEQTEWEIANAAKRKEHEWLLLYLDNDNSISPIVRRLHQANLIGVTKRYR